MVELREQENRILSAIKKLGGKAHANRVTAETGLSDAAIMRAILTLQEKKLVHTEEEKKSTVRLAKEGKMYAIHGLPERRIVDALKKLGGKGSLGQVFGEAGLEPQFNSIALGWVQRKEWAKLDSRTKILEMYGEPSEGNDERLLKLLARHEQESVEELSPEIRDAVKVLKGRKLVVVEEKTGRMVELTAEGQKVSVKAARVIAEVTQLTPELIVSGKWREAKLQKYNIEAAVDNTWPGKRHPYAQFLDDVKQKLVTLGFKQMSGTVVETSFFNFDALYTPQDHPAREWMGMYLVKSPKYGSLSADKRVIENVKRTHEDGWKTGSTGWRYKYSKKEAKRLILRGHGTCLSARTLLSKDLEIPGRYFSIARCYRPEVLDKTHLTEFNQVEGIVVEENLTLRDLLGILQKFAVEIAGADEFKFKPDYFPFTEPSVELSAYKKGCGWIEFGGSGIFRPEVTLPLGIKVPVIAWGLGIDRLFMMRARIDDIRQIFSQDLDWIRRKEVA